MYTNVNERSHPGPQSNPPVTDQATDPGTRQSRSPKENEVKSIHVGVACIDLARGGNLELGLYLISNAFDERKGTYRRQIRSQVLRAGPTGNEPMGATRVYFT